MVYDGFNLNSDDTNHDDRNIQDSHRVYNSQYDNSMYGILLEICMYIDVNNEFIMNTIDLEEHRELSWPVCVVTPFGVSNPHSVSSNIKYSDHNII